MEVFVFEVVIGHILASSKCFETFLFSFKNVNSCPLDRKQFNNLKIKKDKDGQVIEEV